MREAILLANQAGQGREVAILHNNLGLGLWALRAPRPHSPNSPPASRMPPLADLTEMAEWATTSTLSPRFDTGEPELAITLAGHLTQRFQSDQATLVEVRSVEARIHTLRGQPALAADFLEWLETTSRDTAAAEILVSGLGSAAITHAALGNATHAIALLSELAATPDTHDNSMYAAYLPALVRTAVGSIAPTPPTALPWTTSPTRHTRTTPSSPPPPRSPKHAATMRRPPTATLTPPGAGNGSASSPNTPTPSRATAAA